MTENVETPATINTYTWGLRGVQIRAAGGMGQHVASYVTNRDDGRLLAAAPRMMSMLIDVCDTLDRLERGSSSCAIADRIREELATLAPKHYNALASSRSTP